LKQKKSSAASVEPPASNAAELAIGRRLRILRKLRKLPLQDIAAETGLSIGLISQIERGLSSPSVKHLMALGQCLGVSIAWFFDDSAALDPDEAKLVVRRETRRQLEMDHGSVRKELLSPEGGNPQHRVFLITVEPKGTTGKGFYAHQGEVSAVLISGSLQLWIEKEKFTLREGDSFAIPRNAMRRFANPDPRTPAVLVWSIAYFQDNKGLARAASAPSLADAVETI